MSTTTIEGDTLKIIQTQHSDFMKRWRQAGRPVALWTCPHCQATNDSPAPTVATANSRGQWDSCKTCISCGKLSMVIVHVGGATEVVNL